MLDALFIITIMALSLEDTELAYRDYLGYQTVASGSIARQQADSWGLPELGGKSYLVMQPQSQAGVYLRFIEGASADFKPMRRVGWNATEILVQDPDQLAKALAASPFKVVGKPAYLTDKRNVRAFQALGPSNEQLYFTRILDANKSMLDLGSANSAVDRVFIMVLGSHDLAKTKAFFADQLGNATLGPIPYRIAVLSRVYGLAEDSLHALMMVDLQAQFAIEVDQYPPQAASYPRRGVPSGVMMVSVLVNDLEPLNLNWLSAPRVNTTAPYAGRLSGIVRTPSGALLELVASPMGRSQ